MGGILSTPKPPPAVKPPPIPEPTPMPDPDDEAAKLAKQRDFAKRRQRSGRLSTIRTQTAPGSSTLGSE